MVNSSEGHQVSHGAHTGVGPIEPAIARFPFCLVWTPLPVITWFLPFVGHTGIASSTGVIRDFAGSFMVNEDDMAFGSPTRYVQLDPAKVRSLTYTYNESIRTISIDFNQKQHNLFLQNCHSHVACCLNRMLYEGRDDWNMFKVAWLFVREGHFVGRAEMISTLAPFMVVLVLVVFLVLLLN
ncbi:hypothetical protein SARC_00765 [Sphaeroforma arctica JP610]|uniref:Uncharacterized protein n=1 Tax=Sphaeroforma arctica JP610 TaxID=667725 RepID=A0A0L0GDX5_9EUKA|nr:hypothetical protein SARC_00765 [Sphaeroforma arctica JP610]KNC87089.1 hypothetical protein SARC_00765 [Sphaeroforma arctica JP610]|eukprot:XP_014160991.1 hypothetical protein SARC_00765 [Sphaeroforma arctica JP610]